MSENIFSESRVDMAIVLSHLSMLDNDRERCIKALGAMKLANEMHEMLELAISLMDGDSIEDFTYQYQEISKLLAKARGES